MVTTLAVGEGMGAAPGGGETGGLAGAHEDKPSASTADTTITDTFLMGYITNQSRYPSTEKDP